MANSVEDVQLRGMTWNHTRGYLPMVATAQRFAEMRPGVEIVWRKRSLQQFADAPLARLAAEFDLLVIDHPSIGEAAEHGLLVALEEHLPEEFLADQAANSVGQSHASYAWGGHQFALAIDAATPIAGYRPDLLPASELPGTWDDVIALARAGRVAVPAIPIDSLMHLFMLANALGSEPFREPGEVIPAAAGVEALQLLRELVQLAAPGSLERNPIRTWELLASSESICYCPFAYGYSNYSRDGYAAHPLRVCAPASFRGVPLRTTLGGAGLAISARCEHLPEALAYAQYCASGRTQRTIYADAGGQPGHRGAWSDTTLNAFTGDFFGATLPTLDAAWVRPRFAGFLVFQDRASALVHAYLAGGGSEREVLARMNDALREVRV